MARFDMSPEQLVVYRPEREEPDDFDAFWAKTLSEALEYQLEATFEQADHVLSLL